MYGKEQFSCLFLQFCPQPKDMAAYPCPPRLLPHETQEYQQDEADEPPGRGKGLGHGESTCAHNEVKHVHQPDLEPTGTMFSQGLKT